MGMSAELLCEFVATPDVGVLYAGACAGHASSEIFVVEGAAQEPYGGGGAP